MAKKDEFEIPGEDYEVIPLTPLRRLEKRLESIETSKSMDGLERFIDKALNMVELNQKIVEEVVKANQGLREDLAVLVGKMDQTNERTCELIEIIKEAGDGEEEGKSNADDLKNIMTPLIERIEDIKKSASDNNISIAEALASMDKRIKRMQTASVQRPASDILSRRRAQGVPEDMRQTRR